MFAVVSLNFWRQYNAFIKITSVSTDLKNPIFCADIGQDKQ